MEKIEKPCRILAYPTGSGSKPIDKTLVSHVYKYYRPKFLFIQAIFILGGDTMGSRGQAIKAGGFKEYHYHTIMRYNNVRFIVQNDGKSIKLPEMSNSRWAVYTTLGKNGKIKSVSFYNGSRKNSRKLIFTTIKA